MRRTTVLAVVATVTAVLGLTGCGKADQKPDPGSAGESSTPATSTNPGPTTASTLSRAHPGRLELVRADVLVTKGPCRSEPVKGLVCSDGRSYRFDPGRVRVVGVVSARSMSLDSTTPPAWSIALQLSPAGTRAFAKLTRAAASTHESALLMVPGTRRVLIAADVQSEIRDGSVQISGGYTEARATRVVNLITATAG